MSDRMEMFDDETPADAVVAAWLDEGPNTTHHRAARHGVRLLMPLLGRALDRLAEQKVEQVLGGEQSDDQMTTIRAWVGGDVVDNGKLLAELRYWAEYWGPS